MNQLRRTPHEQLIDDLVDDLKAIFANKDTKPSQIPIQQIIREDLLNKHFTIPRKLFSFLSRALNAHGYQCTINAACIDPTSKLIDVEVTHASK